MSLWPNPANAPPLLSPGQRSSADRRTPSHSPVRPSPRDVDPLLRDLSPTTTLRCFASDTRSADGEETGFEAVSSAERALGVKAAQACLSFRSWYRELDSWEWKGGFEPHGVAANEPARLATSVLEQKWTQLTPKNVEDYDRRVQEISRELDDIDVEELKDFALSAHHFTSSSDGVQHNIDAAAIRRLEDYTALITATILQALPFLSRVVKLLNVWTVRLAICRKAPSYLQDLLKAKLNLDQGRNEVRNIALIESSNTIPSLSELDQARDAVASRKTTLATQIASLGTRLDSFLDDLEGRDEIVPDFWIDEFENLEVSYSSWSSQADKNLLKCEWLRNRISAISSDNQAQQNDATSGAADGLHHAESPVLDRSDPQTIGERTNSHGDERQSPRVGTDSHAQPKDNTLLSPSSPSNRPRHVPIILDYDGDGQDYPSEGITGDGGRPIGILPRTGENMSVDPPFVPLRKRSPFLNGQIENAESLQKQVRSPVRPFEHASTAFTRLFKKDKQPEKLERRGSNGSTQSNTSIRTDLDGLARGRQASLTPISVRSQMFDPESVANSRISRSVSSRNSMVNLDRSTSRPKIVTRGSSSHTADRSAEPRSAVSATEAFAMASSPAPSSPKLLSSPFPPSESPEPPENWPLRSPSPSGPKDNPLLEFNSNSHVLPTSAVHSPSRARPFPSEFDTNFVIEPTSTHAPSSGRPELKLNTQTTPEDQNEAVSFHRRQFSEGSQSLNSQAEYSPAEIATAVIAGRMNVPREPQDLAESFALPSIENKAVDDIKEGERADAVRRASYTSIEAHPRSAVKSIQVVRRSSYPSRTPSYIDNGETPPSGSNDPSPVDSGEVYQFPSPPSSKIPRLSGSRPSSLDHPIPVLAAANIIPSSPPQALYQESESVSGQPPLNATMSKQRQSVQAAASPPESPSAVHHRRSQNQPQDSFDRHVSDVVQRLHSNIRFSRAGAETPVSGRATPGVRAPVVKPRGGRQSLGSEHTMTIAPAESNAKRSSTTAEPVKLYHLRQEGREEPIKLFVRLVGEDERVMVRVGGGWADLADYLCQYAEHHGSRTVSGNVLEVLPADTGDNNGSGTGGIRRVSGSTDFVRAKTPVTPGGRGGGREFDSSRPVSRDEVSGSPHFDISSGSPSLATGLNSATMPSAAVGSSSARSTPRSIVTRTGFTSNNNSPRPSTPEVSSTTLAGPRRSAGPSSDHKARWVEGMIEKARASADQDKSRVERDKHFGDIGRIGGTRRVIFRSSSAAGGPGVSEGSK